MNILPDMNRYGEYFATNEEYIRKYRFCQRVPSLPRLLDDELRPHLPR